MKKVILSFFLCFMVGSIYSQMTQNWNYQNRINPATNGLFYKHEANAATNFQSSNSPIDVNLFLGSYSTYFEKSKIGLGLSFYDVNVPKKFANSSDDWNVKLAANRQIIFNEHTVFSAGLGAGFFRSPNYYVDGNGELLKRNELTFTTDVGLAFRWRRLSTSLGVNHFLGDGLLSSKDFRSPTWNAFASYAFGKRDGIELIPNVMYNVTYFNTAGYDNLQVMLLAQYKSKFMVGTGIDFRDTWINTIGITLVEKFRVSYSYALSKVFGVSNNLIGRHEINVAILINRRDLY